MSRIPKQVQPVVYLLAGIATVVSLVRLAVGSHCRPIELSGFPSPSGRLRAVVYERDCGSRGDTTTRVSLVPSGMPAFTDSDLVLVLAGSEGRGFGGGPEVRVVWSSDSLLSLDFQPSSKVVASRSSRLGVAIRLKSAL